MATLRHQHSKCDENPAFEAAFSYWIFPRVSNIRHLRPFSSRLRHVKMVILRISDVSTPYRTTEMIYIEKISHNIFLCREANYINSSFPEDFRFI